jgi:hypothetical protein
MRYTKAAWFLNQQSSRQINSGWLLPACDFEMGAMCEKCVELDTKIEHYRLCMRLVFRM